MQVGTSPGVHLIRVPTPFPVGPTNCWLIEGSPLTLFDTGPLTADALTSLEAGLAALGHRVEDLERLVISHGHIDHFGLAATLKKRSGAKLFLYTDERRMVEQFQATHERIFEKYVILSREAGFPEQLIERSQAEFEIFFRIAQDVGVDHCLVDGEELDSGQGPWQVIHAPGHTPGSLCLLDTTRKRLLSGDVLLRDITTNPFFGGNERTRVGLRYYGPSLEALRALDLDLVLPGHGAMITEARTVIDRMLRHHRVRAGKILDLLAGGALTPYEVTRGLFPKVAGSDQWLALADTMGHLEVLVSDGAVVRDTSGAIHTVALARSP